MCSYSHLTKVNHYRTSGLWLYTSYLQIYIPLYEHTERKNVHFCGNLLMGQEVIFMTRTTRIYIPIKVEEWFLIPFLPPVLNATESIMTDWRLFGCSFWAHYITFLTFDIYFWSIWNKKKIFDINGENKFFCNLCRVFSLNWSASVLHV